MARLFRSINFRLTAAYTLLFLLSVLLLGAMVYLSTASALEEQLRRQIETQTSQLMIEYTDDGLEDLREAIQETIQASNGQRLHYFLQSPSGKIIFDDLSAPLAPPYGWQAANTARGNALLLLSTPLRKGYVLAVGAELTPVTEAKQVILTSFLWAFLGTLVIGILGGMALSRRFLAQVDAITRTAEAIDGTHLEKRIPLRHTGDDLDHLASTINNMLDRIQQLIGNLQRVSGNIAHDLRTPLAHLQQRLEKISTLATTPELEEEVDASRQQLDEILSIFAAMLRISEIDSGTRRTHFESVDLSTLVTQIAQAFQPSAEESGHNIRHDVTPDLTLQGDRQLLMQMLTNLIENSLQHTPSGSEITLQLHGNASAITLIISDTGAGIPTELHEEIFKPFYRLEASRHSKGSGLGLSLVAAIARLHRASITVQNNEPGLRFLIHFFR